MRPPLPSKPLHKAPETALSALLAGSQALGQPHDFKAPYDLPLRPPQFVRSRLAFEREEGLQAPGCDDFAHAG